MAEPNEAPLRALREAAPVVTQAASDRRLFLGVFVFGTALVWGFLWCIAELLT